MNINDYNNYGKAIINAILLLGLCLGPKEIFLFQEYPKALGIKTVLVNRSEKTGDFWTRLYD